MRRLFFLVTLIAGTSWCLGQTQGSYPFETVASSNYESLNLADLSITVKLPIRGKIGAIPFSFTSGMQTFLKYSSSSQGNSIWMLNGSAFSAGGADGMPSANYHYNISQEQCPGPITNTVYSGFSITTGDGASHPLSPAFELDNTGCHFPTSGSATTIDGSGYTLVVPSNASGVIYDPSGTKAVPAYSVVARNARVTDSNGNILYEPSKTDNPNPCGMGGQPLCHEIDNYTDTLGATAITVDATQISPSWFCAQFPNSTFCVPPYPSFVVRTNSFSYTDAAGHNQSYTVNYAQYHIATAFHCPLVPDATGTAVISLPNSVTFPDGSALLLGYEPTSGFGSGYTTGRIASITLPTGGLITYAYSGGTNGINCQNGSIPTLTRTTTDGVWTYNYTPVPPTGGQATTTIIDPSLNKTVYTFFYGPAWLPTQRQEYQGSSTLLRTTTICYNGQVGLSACASTHLLPAWAVTEMTSYVQLPNSSGLMSELDTRFDSFGQATERDAYDWGSGAPGPQRLKTLMTYGTWTGSSCAAIGSYINDRICDIKQIQGTQTLAESRFTYDIHGNQTSRSRLVSGTTYLTSSETYNANGTVKTMRDVNGAQSSYSYDSNICNGFVSTGISEPLTLSKSMTWDCNGGVRLTSVDENSQLTTYVYNDPFWRITEVDYPDGGKTTTTYNDTASPRTIVQNQLITTGVNLTTQTTLDGLGRTTRTAITSDPDGADYTDMTYDGAGRLATKSNPHRSGASSTDGTTQYRYDALGRTTQVIQSDGSVAATTYSNNCSTATDEAGKARKTCTDALGRVTAVWEDPGGSNYETDYTYDALGNLNTVTQKGGSTSGNWRSRSFSYDGLSRLLSATNPESGTITYTYDGNGNLLTKTSPAPNQTNSSVTQTISYCYDALNRMISKWYTAPTCTQASPLANYFYDQTAYNGLTIAYGLGRRTGMSDGSGATAWSYDKMGRLAKKTQTISTFAKTTGHTYNLDGSIATISNPGVGRVMTYTTSAAGRSTAVQNTGGAINFLQSAHFAPFGGLTSATESSAAITLANSYNNRLQPALVSASSTSGTILSLCYDFHLLGGLNLSPCIFSGTSPGNNGNAYQLVNNRDVNRTQNFFYDSLSRVQQAYTNGNSPLSTSWGETFTIDAWGNLTNRGPVSGKTQYEGLSCPANTQNQLTTCTLTYDAAGDVMANGSAGYTYDAENHLIAAGGYTYTYDGDGRRVKKTNGSTGTLYYADMDGKVLNESSLGATNLREYVYFNDKRIARMDVPTPLTVKYYFSDNLGSASVITDANGTMPPLEESDYYPYGGEIVVTNGDSNNYKFTSKERDIESGLDNFGARYNASTMGRFTSPDNGSAQDSGNPQSWNLYSYVMNQPTIFTDPDGHDCFYVDPESGAWEGFNRGDCDNSTEEKANAGNYVNGTVDSITYNQESGSLDYGYHDDENGSVGAGTIIGVAQPQQGPMDTGAVSAGFLGPGDLILFSGVRLPSFVSEVFGKVFGSILGKTIEGTGAGVEDILANAGSAVGNQTIKASSRAVAEDAAEKWVGEGARPIFREGEQVGFVSADGTKVARWTSAGKPDPYINLTNNQTGGNLHVHF